MSSRLLLFLPFLIVGLLSPGGCATWNQTDFATDGEIAVTTSTSNVGRIMPDGQLAASYHGLGAHVWMQDPSGNWGISPIPQATLTFPTPGGIVFLGSPKDAKLTGVDYDPNSGRLKVESIEVNISQPITASAPVILGVIEQLRGMTEEEAKARVEQMRLAGEITKSVADLVLQLLPLILGAS